MTGMCSSRYLSYALDKAIMPKPANMKMLARARPNSAKFPFPSMKMYMRKDVVSAMLNPLEKMSLIVDHIMK